MGWALAASSGVCQKFSYRAGRKKCWVCKRSSWRGRKRSNFPVLSKYCQPFCVNLLGEKALQQWHPSLTFFGHCPAEVGFLLLERSFWASTQRHGCSGKDQEDSEGQTWKAPGTRWALSPSSCCGVCCDLLFMLFKTFHGTGKLWFAAVAWTKTASGVIVCV